MRRYPLYVLIVLGIVGEVLQSVTNFTLCYLLQNTLMGKCIFDNEEPTQFGADSCMDGCVLNF